MNEYLEVKAHFFGNEVQKKHVYIDFILPYFKKILGRYYAERDWLGGPHYKIILLKEEIDILETFEVAFRDYCLKKYGQLSEGEIEQNLKPYLKYNEVIPGMERRTPKPIVRDHHLTVTVAPFDQEYLKNTFNSTAHFKVHTQGLFKLQTLVDSHLEFMQSLEKRTQLQYLTRMFYDVLSLSRFSRKYSMLVYLSNIEGVFAISNQFEKSTSLREKFEKVYQEIEAERSFHDVRYPVVIGDKWLSVVNEIAENIKQNLDKLSESEQGFFSLEDQKQRLIANIESIDSPFHQSLVQGELDQLLNHEEHKLFKHLINLVYKASHLLGFSFMEKNIACYAVVKYILDQNGSSWEEILMERGPIQ